MQTGRSENQSTKRPGESAPHQRADRKRARRSAGYRLAPQTGSSRHKVPGAFRRRPDSGPLHVGYPIRPYQTRHNTGQDTARPVPTSCRNVRHSDRRRPKSPISRLTRSNLPFRSKVAPYTLPDSSLSAIRWSGGQQTNIVPKIPYRHRNFFPVDRFAYDRGSCITYIRCIIDRVAYGIGIYVARQIQPLSPNFGRIVIRIVEFFQ